MTSFAELTTMRVGGEPSAIVAPTTAEELVESALAVWAGGEEWLALGGGSNVIAADGPLDVSVLRVATRGIRRLDGPGVVLRVEAGEPWDALVAHTVAAGWRGIEALSGIPGTVGAAPVQNIGAYGQEISDTLAAVDFLDSDTREVTRLSRDDLQLGYRTSVLKYERRGIVLAVELSLQDDAGDAGAPVRYAQLAHALRVELGESAPIADVRSAVLALRASKGMVLDTADPDSVSAGSFFTNPIVSAEFARTLPVDAPRFAIAPEPRDVYVPLGHEPAAPERFADDRVKLSAAWLIEHAGLARGFRLPGSRAAISSKHTLAIVNVGGASAEEIAQLGRYIQTRVMSEFGVVLQPEPLLVGLSL